MKKTYRSVEKTKNAIRAAFVELLREKNNLDRISVAELVERANIAKSTFYYHYEDIYSIVEEFEDAFIKVISDFLDKCACDVDCNYRLYIDKVMQFLKEKEVGCREVIHSSYAPVFTRKLKNMLVKKIINDVKNFPLVDTPEKKLIKTHFIVNACVDTLVDYYKGKFEGSLDTVKDVVDEGLQLLLHSKRS